MDEQILQSIDRKLDVLLKLTAAILVSDKKLSEGAPLLAACGVDRQIIADLYSTTPDSASVQISKAKKKNTDTAKT